MELELVDPHASRAAAIWSELPAPSFFTSWGWIGTWLACVPTDRAIQLLVVRDGGRPVAAGCLGVQRTIRHGFVPLRSLHLNTTGVERLDELIIEYNGLTGREPPLIALLDELARMTPWDELVLPGVREQAFGGVAALEGRYRLSYDRRSPVYFVDLEAVRARGYTAQLSSNTRNQIKRAHKAAGEVTLEVAGDAAHAIEIYDQLRALHTAAWRAHAIEIYDQLRALHTAAWRERGHPGAFTDPWIDRFHRRLIATRFAAGEVQLLRVRTGTRVHGCLYNFVWRGRVLQYQTGFRPSTEARDKPGYVCHTVAIEHCARHGLAVYDFLAGEHRYKESLSTANAELVWCKVQRPRWRFAVEDRVVELVRRVRNRAA